MLYLSTPQHPLSQGPVPNLPQNLTRPAQRALTIFKKNNENIPSYKQNGVLPTTGDSNIELKKTKAMQAILHDCHKAVCWKQTGLVKSASGPCDQHRAELNPMVTR